MTKKVVLVGKAALSTIMVSGMVCSTLSTNIYANEIEGENDNSIVEALETENSIEGNGSAVPNTVLLNSSSLTQSSKYPNSSYEKYSVDELKQMLQQKISEAEGLWNQNGGYNYYKSNQNIRTFLSNIDKAKLYLEEGNSTAMTFAWRVYEMESAIKGFNSSANILSALDKQIYALNAEKDTLNESDYTVTSWKAYVDKIAEAVSKVNGSGTSDQIKQQYIDEINNLKANLQKVDSNLIKLNSLILESEAIINKQTTDEKVNYDGTAWRTFLNALNDARDEVNKGKDTIDVDTFNTLYKALEDAKNALVPLSEDQMAGTETGLTGFWLKDSLNNVNIFGGQVFVSGEQCNEDGTTTLYITWINNGVNPLTGGKFENGSNQTRWDKNGSYRPLQERDTKKYDFSICAMIDKNEFGDYYLNNVKELLSLSDKDVLNGFTNYAVTVPTGSKVILGIGSRAGTYVGTFSAGVYQTKLDESAPGVSVDYSTTEKTKDPVTVTITADEAIQDIPGWTKVSDTVFTKVYDKNTTEKVDVTDLSGNTRTVTVSIANIITDEETKPETGNGNKEDKVEDKKTSTKKDKVKTSVFSNVGFFTSSAMAAAAGTGILSFLKNRKK